MPLPASIDRLNERNYVGLCHLDVVDVADVDTLPDEFEGNVAGTVELKEGKSWTRIYLDDNGGLFRDRWVLRDGDQYSAATISGAIAKDRLSLMPRLWALKGKRYLVVFTTRNGDQLLMGTLKYPATALVTDRTAGDDPDSDRNEYEVEFSLTRRLPVPFYNGTPPVPGTPGDCPSLATQLSTADWDDDIEPNLSPAQLAAAEASICPTCSPLGYGLQNSAETLLLSGVVEEPCGETLLLTAPSVAIASSGGLFSFTAPSGTSLELPDVRILDAAGNVVFREYQPTPTVIYREQYELYLDYGPGDGHITRVVPIDANFEVEQQDGASGSIKYRINAGSWVAFGSGVVVNAGDTLEVERSSTGSAGWVLIKTAYT